MKDEKAKKLERFFYKITKTAERLKANPSDNAAEAFKKLVNDYKLEVEFYANEIVLNAQIMARSSKKVLNNNYKPLTTNATLITKGGNKAVDKSKNSIKKHADVIIKNINNFSLSFSSKLAPGTTRGNRAKNKYTTSDKDRMDQAVSTLRRIFYWAEKSDKEAEKLIDKFIKNCNITNYTKSSRRGNGYVYRPVELSKIKKYINGVI
jgi:hypothetical protein